MNDLSQNKYLKQRHTDISDYSIRSFLEGDIAVKQLADEEKIQFAVSNLVVAHRFNIHLRGFNYLIELASSYVLDEKYNEVIKIGELAEREHCSYDFIRQCIVTSIIRNKSFVKLASHTLGIPLQFEAGSPDISETVEILGALFVIYYNYTVPTK